MINVPHLAFAILAAVLGALMSLLGVLKIAGHPKVKANMAQVNFTGAMLKAEGVVELLAGVVTLVPLTRNLGLLGLCAIFIGAIGSHVGAGQPLSKAGPAMFALLLSMVTFAGLNGKALFALLVG